MKSLVIGMNIGQLYKSVLLSMGHEVVTVDLDPDKNADYQDCVAAYMDHEYFDTVHVCTPNYTHLNIAKNCANYGAKIIFIDKPGVENSELWHLMVSTHPETRFMMVKNNQYRADIKNFKRLAESSDTVYIRWNNANRIPSPGSWFTTKNLSFGGVSRDLMPHMLSYYCALTDYQQGTKLKAVARQHYNLEDITSTDYGTVNANGTYDVDDFCHLEFQNGDTKWVLTANWKTNLNHDDSSISFSMGNSAMRHELGLCPESAYRTMIETAIANIANDKFYRDQVSQDIWIHQQIENL